MTPEEFYEKMCNLTQEYREDQEVCHIKMDNLMCYILTELGYGEGVEIFYKTYKWYS